MTTRLKEITIERVNTTTGEKKVLFSKIINNSADFFTKGSIQRLCSVYEQQDENLLKYVPKTAVIRKMLKDSNFTDMGEIIFKKDVKNNFNTHKRALKRLAGVLQCKEDERNIFYVGSLDMEKIGVNCYNIYERSFSLLSIKDKEKMLKRKVSSQKGTLTKTINQAKKIRNSYKNSLFPDDYKNNPKFIRLAKLAALKRNNLKEVKKLVISDISNIDGSPIHPLALKSFEKLCKIEV